MIDPFYVQEDDYLEEIHPQLKRALGFTDEDLHRLSPEARNLFSARRKLGHTWLDDYEIAVEVSESHGGCHCGIEKGQQLVFDMRHKLLPEQSTAPLCVHMISPVLSLFYMTFDRAAEGLNPMTCVWRFQECPLSGSDHGASKAKCVAHIRRRDTKEPVTERILPPKEMTS